MHLRGLDKRPSRQNNPLSTDHKAAGRAMRETEGLLVVRIPCLGRKKRFVRIEDLGLMRRYAMSTDK
jgi:hypothetical protein